MGTIPTEKSIAMFTTATKDGKVYLVATDSDYNKPVIYRTYWPTEASAAVIPDNTPVYVMANGAYIVHVFNRDLSVNPIRNAEPFTETTPYLKPRGAKKYSAGEWH